MGLNKGVFVEAMQAVGCSRFLLSQAREHLQATVLEEPGPEDLEAGRAADPAEEWFNTRVREIVTQIDEAAELVEKLILELPKHADDE